MSTIYSGYMVSFTTSVPSVGPFDAIAYGKNSFSFGSLGDAPTDPGNIASGQVGGIATGNFDFILDEFTGGTDRAIQIDQVSTALAGTGAHELGHTLGLFHHHAYSDISITPATYLATGGAQNTHIMATGPTGLDESGREVLRDFSPWERAMFDIAGGATAYYPMFDNQKLVASPVPIGMVEVGPFDAGSTPMTAVPLTFAPGETSGLDLAFMAGDIDGSPADVDWYGLLITEPSRVMAEVFTANRFAPPFSFDATLTLLSSSGMPLTSSDDVFYDGDVYGTGTFRQDDPYLLNIPVLMPGLYYISVAPSPMPSPGLIAGPLDAYWLVVGKGFVPEPCVGYLALAGMLILMVRRFSIRPAVELGD